MGHPIPTPTLKEPLGHSPTPPTPLRKYTIRHWNVQTAAASPSEYYGSCYWWHWLGYRTSWLLFTSHHRRWLTRANRRLHNETCEHSWWMMICITSDNSRLIHICTDVHVPRRCLPTPVCCWLCADCGCPGVCHPGHAELRRQANRRTTRQVRPTVRCSSRAPVRGHRQSLTDDAVWRLSFWRLSRTCVCLCCARIGQRHAGVGRDVIKTGDSRSSSSAPQEDSGIALSGNTAELQWIAL